MNDVIDLTQHIGDLKSATEQELDDLRTLIITGAWEDGLSDVTDADRRAVGHLLSDVTKEIDEMRLRKLQDIVQDFVTHEQDLNKAREDVRELTVKFQTAAQRIKAIGDFVMVVGRILKVFVSFAT